MNLSIKNIPEDVVESLRRRAARNHRSLQGELSAIVEAAACDAPADALGLLADIRALGKPTPNDAVAIIRADRDRDESR